MLIDTLLELKIECQNGDEEEKKRRNEEEEEEEKKKKKKKKRTRIKKIMEMCGSLKNIFAYKYSVKSAMKNASQNKQQKCRRRSGRGKYFFFVHQYIIKPKTDKPLICL